MNAQEYHQRGEEAFSRGDWDQAIADLTEAYRLEPNPVEIKMNLSAAYFNRGISQFKKDDIDQAIADITEAIRFNPNYAPAYSARGRMYYQKGDLDAAIRDLTEAIRLDPAAVGGYLARSGCYHGKCNEYRATGDKSNFFKYIDLAIDDTNAALRINPNDDVVREMLGHLTREREARKRIYAMS